MPLISRETDSLHLYGRGSVLSPSSEHTNQTGRLILCSKQGTVLCFTCTQESLLQFFHRIQKINQIRHFTHKLPHILMLQQTYTIRDLQCLDGLSQKIARRVSLTQFMQNTIETVSRVFAQIVRRLATTYACPSLLQNHSSSRNDP